MTTWYALYVDIFQWQKKVGTYSRIGLPRSYGTLQSYWSTTRLLKHTVVLDYYEAIETYSRIELPRSFLATQVVKNADSDGENEENDDDNSTG